MNCLREMRIKRGLSQKQLASLVGTTVTTLSRLEHGRQGARLSLAMLLAQALSVSIEELFKNMGKNRNEAEGADAG